jgi:hypothetical protein
LKIIALGFLGVLGAFAREKSIQSLPKHFGALVLITNINHD